MDHRISVLLGLAALTPLGSAAQAQIKPYQAKPVEPYTAQDLSAGASSRAQQPSAAATQGGLSSFMGSWQLVVEGAVRTDENVAAGTRTVTSSAGALGRRLAIRADGTYQWGEQKGRWRATGEDPKNGWPLMLLKADGGKDWKVGWDTRRQGRAGDILIWDGYVWEVGQPIR